MRQYKLPDEYRIVQDSVNDLYKAVNDSDSRWKLEAEKFAAQAAMKSGKNAEALSHIDAVRENTARNDWANNLFAGVSYFVLGEKEKGIDCVELNLNFGSEQEISGAVIAQMNAGKLDLAVLPEELRKAVGLSALRIDTLKALALEGDLESQLRLGRYMLTARFCREITRSR